MAKPRLSYIKKGTSIANSDDSLHSAPDNLLATKKRTLDTSNKLLHGSRLKVG